MKKGRDFDRGIMVVSGLLYEVRQPANSFAAGLKFIAGFAPATIPMTCVYDWMRIALPVMDLLGNT